MYEAILSVTRDLTPTETSLKMSTTRLTRALEELQAQLAAAGQDYHPEWDGADGVIVVRIADEQGPLPVGAFASRIAAARRDQQLLLSDSEQRILEDALLTRLAPADPRTDRGRQGPDPQDEHRDAVPEDVVGQDRRRQVAARRPSRR